MVIVPVMMSSAVVFVKTFRATRKPFRDRAKTVRLPAGITVRLQPGILFVFTPERFSRSPRNRVHLPPESASISMKVSEKGAVSVYGLGRFPVTLYQEQWLKLLAMADEIKRFIEENRGRLEVKEESYIHLGWGNLELQD